MLEMLLKVRYFERGLSKTPKKSTLFFLPNPVPLNGQSYQKQKWRGTRLRNKFKKNPLLVISYLTKFIDVI